MIRLSGLAAAAAAALWVAAASAQIIPDSGTPDERAVPAVEPVAPDPAPPPAPSPPPAEPALQTGFSNTDLEAAFRAVGLAVTHKTAPNGLQYIEGRTGGDIVFGAGMKCAGANATDCKVLMLQSGTLNKSVPYADMMKFSVAGLSSRAVTFDPSKKNPALLQITSVYGRFEPTLLTGALRSLLGDMQAFLGMLQGQPIQAYAASIPEARISGAFSGSAFDAAGRVQLAGGSD